MKQLTQPVTFTTTTDTSILSTTEATAAETATSVLTPTTNPRATVTRPTTTQLSQSTAKMTHSTTRTTIPKTSHSTAWPIVSQSVLPIIRPTSIWENIRSCYIFTRRLVVRSCSTRFGVKFWMQILSKTFFSILYNHQIDLFVLLRLLWLQRHYPWSHPQCWALWQ